MRGLTANAFCASILQPEIDRLGGAAFASADGSAKPDCAQLYSGPAWSIRKLVGTSAINPVRSVEQAKRMNAQRIDDTAIGQFLYSKQADMFREFTLYFGAGKDEEVDEAIRQVWTYASKAFVKSGFKSAVTAVCGADPKGVFRAYELKTILNGKNILIKTINGKPLIHFRRVYRLAGRGEIGFYAAFMEVCKTELEDTHRAVAAAPTPMERMVAEEDHQARKLFFELEQASHDPTEAALAALAAHTATLDGKPYLTHRRPSKRPLSAKSLSR
jgi:hypothetical protein